MKDWSEILWTHLILHIIFLKSSGSKLLVLWVLEYSFAKSLLYHRPAWAVRLWFGGKIWIMLCCINLDSICGLLYYLVWSGLCLFLCFPGCDVGRRQMELPNLENDPEIAAADPCSWQNCKINIFFNWSISSTLFSTKNTLVILLN